MKVNRESFSPAGEKVAAGRMSGSGFNLKTHPPNAVKDFCSRIRENSGIRYEAIPKSHDFGY